MPLPITATSTEAIVQAANNKNQWIVALKNNKWALFRIHWIQPTLTDNFHQWCLDKMHSNLDPQLFRLQSFHNKVLKTCSQAQCRQLPKNSNWLILVFWEINKYSYTNRLEMQTISDKQTPTPDSRLYVVGALLTNFVVPWNFSVSLSARKQSVLDNNVFFWSSLVFGQISEQICVLSKLDSLAFFVICVNPTKNVEYSINRSVFLFFRKLA